MVGGFLRLCLAQGEASMKWKQMSRCCVQRGPHFGWENSCPEGMAGKFLAQAQLSWLLGG